MARFFPAKSSHTDHTVTVIEAAAEAPTSALLAYLATIAEHWHVDGDELVSDGHGPHLVTPVDYGDFELVLEWKILPGGDSGETDWHRA